jgi:hypothetical protein
VEGSYVIYKEEALLVYREEGILIYRGGHSSLQAVLSIPLQKVLLPSAHSNSQSQDISGQFRHLSGQFSPK